VNIPLGEWMLRSLIAPAGLGRDEDFLLSRNLTREGLEQAHANGECIWMDFVDPTKEEIKWLEGLLNLHPTVVDDLLRYDRRPTLLAYPEYLFLSLFQPQMRVDKVESMEVHCLLTPHLFVTLRDTGTTAVDGAYDLAAQNLDYWRQGMTYFLYLTAQYVVDSYYPLLDRISTRLSDLEEIILDNGGEVHRNSVYRIKQQLITLRQMVAPQREVLSSLIGERRIAETSEGRDLFRHLYERILRVYDVIDSQRDLWSNVLDLIQSQESTRMANAVNRLTVMSMIFLPLTFVVGLFGLNFVTTEPELSIPLSGQVVFGIIVAITVVTSVSLYSLFRRRGWL
jgi:magnesium transporter